MLDNLSECRGLPGGDSQVLGTHRGGLDLYGPCEPRGLGSVSAGVRRRWLR